MSQTRNLSRIKSKESKKSRSIKHSKYRAYNDKSIIIPRLIFEKANLEMKRFIKDELRKLKIEIQTNKM